MKLSYECNYCLDGIDDFEISRGRGYYFDSSNKIKKFNYKTNKLKGWNANKMKICKDCRKDLNEL